ncbi:MAG: hypothetical protein V7605_1911 [Acidimicrobiaceae bacterium]
MRTRAFQQVAIALGSAIVVLVAAGVAVASVRGDDPARPRPPATPDSAVTTTVPPAEPATSAPPLTAAAPRSTSAPSPAPAVPGTTPTTLAYRPFQPPPTTAAPPTTVPTFGGSGGCHESLVPIPECGVGPYVTEPPP